MGEAAALLSKAIRIVEELGEEELAARYHIQMGVLRLHSQDYAGACESTLIGAQGLDFDAAPATVMGALHNLALAAAESGAVKSALWLLARNVELYKQHATPAFQLRLKWTIAKLAFELGEVEPAGIAFDEVRREFLRQGLPYDASLAALDLALVHLARGDNRRVRSLAKEMYAVFKAKQIPREASAALLLFAEAARREAATVESVRQLIRDLKTHLSAPGKSQPPGKFSA